MTTQLAIRDDGMDLMSYGKVMAQSGFFADAREAAQAVVKIQAGRELGFAPVQSMMGIHIIKGKVSLSANLIAAAIKRSGKYTYRVKQHDNTRCDIEFLEGGNAIGNSSFTIQEAQQAGLTNNPTWKNFPRNMLFARALSNGAKWHCADVFGGPVYTPDELGAHVDGEGEVVSQPPTPRPLAPAMPMELDAHERAPEEPSIQVEPTPFDDNEQFTILLNEAFDAGDFAPGDREIVRRKVCAKHKVLDVSALPIDKRKPFIEAIVNGEMDRFKLNAPAMAGK
jgi:hypothetical protein